MSLEGLRAWIGEVERKLTKRTRVFLVLAVIAIGIGGAAVYLAIDARESSVSESDVQALQEQLEGQIGTGGGIAPAAGSAQLEAELKVLQAEVAKLKSGGDGASKDKGASNKSGVGASGNEGDSAPSGGTAGAVPPGTADSARIQEPPEQTRERAEEDE
jgi:cell division protein FtsB